MNSEQNYSKPNFETISASDDTMSPKQSYSKPDFKIMSMSDNTKSGFIPGTESVTNSSS